MVNQQRTLGNRSFFGAFLLFSLLVFLGGCNYSLLDDDSSTYQKTVFFGRIQAARTVYRSESQPAATGSSAASGGLIGAVIGGLAGAGLSNGNAAGTLVGAGAGAIIGSSIGRGRTIRDSDFSERNNGEKLTKLVIKKDNGDRVVIVQKFTRDLMRGDRVKVSVYRDGSVTVRRVREDDY